MLSSSAKPRRLSSSEHSSLLVLMLCFVSLPSLVTSACPPNYSEVGEACFLVLADSSVEFIDAKTVCQYYQGDIATVKNCAMLGELSFFIASNYPSISEGLWVGGSDLANEGTWLWTDGSQIPLGSPFWGRSDHADWHLEPSGGSAQNCLVLGSHDGYFHDNACDTFPGNSPLCQVDHAAGSCPDRFVMVMGRCLEFLVDVDVTWDDARLVCQDKGGDLAVLDDCNFLTKVIEYAEESGVVPTNGYWLGGSDSTLEGYWTWLDGSAVTMGAPYWGMDGSGSLEPNNANGEDCLLLSAQERFYFNDVDCASMATVLCQANPIEEA